MFIKIVSYICSLNSRIFSSGQVFLYLCFSFFTICSVIVVICQESFIAGGTLLTGFLCFVSCLLFSSLSFDKTKKKALDFFYMNYCNEFGQQLKVRNSTLSETVSVTVSLLLNQELGKIIKIVVITSDQNFDT